MTINKSFSVTGGTYSATSATTQVVNSITIGGGVTFNHNNGTFLSDGSNTVTVTLNTGSAQFNHLNLMGWATTFSVTGTVYVAGNFIFGGPNGSGGIINSGTVDAKGNISSQFNGAGGTATIKATGSSSQNITGNGTAEWPTLEVASTGGTVTLANTFYFTSDYTYTSGTIDAGTSTLYFKNYNASIRPGSSINYYNVTLAANQSGGATTLNSQTWNINGTFTSARTASSGSLNSGTINAAGNIVLSGSEYAGSANLNINGNTNTTITTTGTTKMPGALVTINKTGGSKVSLTGATYFNSTNQNFTVTAGILDMAGYALTVAGNISNSGTIYRGTNPTCGLLTMGGTLTGTASYCKSQNIALASNGSVATASSSYSAGFLPATANNGERNGSAWGSNGGWNDNTSNSFPDWLQITFTMPTLISQIDVITVQDSYSSPSVPTLGMTFTLYGITSYQVQYWNGAVWTDVTGGNVTGNNNVWRQFTFTPISTDRVRVLVNGAVDEWSRIIEVEATSPP